MKKVVLNKLNNLVYLKLYSASIIKSCILFLIVLLANCTKERSIKEDPDPETPKEEWVLVGGDEFNDAQLNTNLWMRYGTTGSGTSKYGQPQGMIQTYRPEQVEMATLPTGEKVARITSIKRTDGNIVNGQIGWWSGAISTRETGVYFPLYCRIDVKARVVNEAGVWHAIWSRYRDGASVAELDLNEFFVASNGKNIVNQAIHLWNSSTSVTDLNLPVGQNRKFAVSDPANTFHIYSVQIDKDTTANNEAIITLLIDNVVSYALSTKNIPNHNRFILDAIANNRLDSVWDVVVTGQIGATSSGVGYPAENLTTAITEIDWVRVYKRK